MGRDLLLLRSLHHFFLSFPQCLPTRVYCRLDTREEARDAGLDSEGKVITDSKNLVDLRGGELKGGISAVLGGTTMDFTEELDDGVVTKEELASSCAARSTRTKQECWISSGSGIRMKAVQSRRRNSGRRCLYSD